MSMYYDSFEPHLYQEGQTIDPPKTKWIWNIFWILLAVTAVEVGLAFVNYYQQLGWKQVLNYIFVFLTIVKAYYIIFSYMHLKDERKNFKLTLGVLIIILSYFIALMMIEGLYQDSVRLILPDFFNANSGGGGHH